MRRIPLLLALLAPPLAATAGAAQAPLAVELRWDNDIIAPRGTGAPPDHDYTQGLHLSAEFGRGANRRLRLGLGQRIYTPRRDAPSPSPASAPTPGGSTPPPRCAWSAPGARRSWGWRPGSPARRRWASPCRTACTG